MFYLDRGESGPFTYTLCSSLERTIFGRKYLYGINQAGGPEVIDETNGKIKFESKLSRYLPPLTPVLTQAGKVAVRQPYFPPKSLKWWRAQCGFRGIHVGGSVSDLQARIHALGDTGLAPEITEAIESMRKEFSGSHYQTLTDSDKAKVFPGRFIQEVFGPQSSRRNETIVVEVEGWGTPIEQAAHTLKVSCELKKMPNYEYGQRLAVVGLNPLRVRAQMAEIERQGQRADRRGIPVRRLDENREWTQADFNQQMQLAKLKDSNVQGQWDVRGTWDIDCPSINSQWFYEDLRCVMAIGITRPNTIGGPQMYAEFDFHILTGIMRFIPLSISPNLTGSSAAGIPSPVTALPTSSNRTVNFRWRGEDAGEGEIQLYSDRRLCSITFHSPHALRGTFIDEATGPVTFEGFKVSDKAANLNLEHEWESRSEEAHGAAGRARWRRG